MNEKEKPIPLYQQLAKNVQWYHSTINSPYHKKWNEVAETNINELIDMLPSGSGIDSGVSIDLENSTENKIVLYCEYHHMNDAGYYDGWTSHTIRLIPDMINGFSMSISGKNRNSIKDYLYELFDYALRECIPEVNNNPDMKKRVYHN